MVKYEQDFIYRVIPNLTQAINRLAVQLEEFNKNVVQKKNKEENEE